MKTRLEKFVAEADNLKEALEATPLFSKPYDGQANEIVIHDAAAAWKYCSSQNLSDEYEYWTGLREKNYAESLASLKKILANSESKDEYFEAADKIETDLFKIVKSRISKFGLGKEIAGAMSEDFANILERRAFRPTPHEWAERMFQIYMSGGWPCGWRGKFPAGQLIVFTPGK